MTSIYTYKNNMSDNQNQNTTETYKQVTAGRIVKKYQDMDVYDVMNETPSNIAAEIVILSAKLYEAASITLKAEQAMAQKWIEINRESDSNKEADMRLKITDEYAEVQMAKNNEKIVIELIRSLKKLLASKAEEARNIY